MHLLYNHRRRRFTMAGTAAYVALVSSVFPMVALCTQVTYYIQPTSNSSCPYHVCLTLSEYASQSSSFSSSDDLTLIFLPGEHVLNKSIGFHLLNSVSLLGNLSSLPKITSTLVMCSGGSAFVLSDIPKVEIKGLAFEPSQCSTDFSVLQGTVHAISTISAEFIPCLKLINCHLIEQNQLPLLLNSSTLYLQSNNFQRNTGQLGGAIAAHNSTIVFLGENIFQGNRATVGGGIYADSSKLLIRGKERFVNNTAEEDGGGICAIHSVISIGLSNESTDLLESNPSDLDTSFVHNSARSGGGIYLMDSLLTHSGGRLQFTTNMAENNNGDPLGIEGYTSKCKSIAGSCGDGGAVAMWHSSWISSALLFFVNNAAEFNGGAVYVRESSMKASARLSAANVGKTPSSDQQVQVIDMTFVNNSCRRGNGGAVKIQNATVVFSGSSCFERNSAYHGEGGGIFAEYSEVNFTTDNTLSKQTKCSKTNLDTSCNAFTVSKFRGFCKVVGNTALFGGGISLRHSTMIQDGVTLSFVSNHAIANGGGINSDWSLGSLHGVTRFEKNTAGMIDYGVHRGEGGAIQVQFGMWSTAVITFVGNVARRIGGAVSLHKCQVNFGMLPANLANTQHQELNLTRFGSAKVCIPHSSFVNNHASHGGAIKADDSIIEFTGSSKFCSNLAYYGKGGGLNAYRSEIIFKQLKNASLNYDGVVLGSLFGDILCDGLNEIVQNEAEEGGGMALESSTMTHISGTFNMTGNFANSGAGLHITVGSHVVLSSHTIFRNNIAVQHALNYGFGGAVIISSSTWTSSSVTFIGNIASASGGAVYSERSQMNFGGLGYMPQGTTSSTLISGEHGLHFLQESSHLSTFVNNSGRFGGAFTMFDSVVQFACSSLFSRNSAKYDGGGITAESSTIYFNDSITFETGTTPSSVPNELRSSIRITFSWNSAGRRGGGIQARSSMLVFSGENVFVGNSAQNGGGGIYLMDSDVNISGNGTYTNNTAGISGGSICVINGSLVFDGGANFTRNSAIFGGAVSIEHSKCLFRGTTSFCHNFGRYGGAISVEEDSVLTLTGMSRFVSNVVSSSGYGGYGGGIHAVRTLLMLSGTLIFDHNSARYGGGLAISYYDNSHYLLLSNASVTFRFNVAQKHGGAVHIEDAPFTYCVSGLDIVTVNNMCFVQLHAQNVVSNNPDLVGKVPEKCQEWFDDYINKTVGHITFEGNTAGEGGYFIHGGALEKCMVQIDTGTSCGILYYSRYRKTYYISGIEVVAALSGMTVEHMTRNHMDFASEAFKVCICESHKPKCDNRAINRTTYPGETINFSVVAVGQLNGTVPAVIHAVFTEPVAWLDELQGTQAANMLCTSIRYTVFSDFAQDYGNNSARLILSAEGPCGNTGTFLAIEFNLLSCPIAFALSRFGYCGCEKRLQKYTNSCDINHRTLRRTSDFWVGRDHTGLILHPHCPFDYCKLEPVSFTLNSTDLQCANGRSGTLCGACKSVLSLNLGSSRCSSCSNTFLILLLPFAIAGLLLVVFLFTCRVTVAAGTTGGLILYANVLAVNRSVFFSSGETNILTVFIAWLNLDLGIETCLYDGLDAYTLTWLQFVFPLYMWVLVGVIALVSNYSTIIARVIGPTNPIAVLATLFLLSYTKLLRTIITTFSFTTLDYPNDRTVTVWVYDGNIAYLQGKHIPLFLAGLLAFLFLFLPYTLLLLFGQCIEAGSNHRLLFWVNNPKVKSFLDAYHAPYKNRHRYWIGLLLLLRFVLFIISAVVDINSPRDPSVNLLVLVITTSLVLTWTLITGSVYKHWYNTILKSSFILNLAILAVASYQVKVEGGNQAAVVYSSVGIALVTFLGIIVYHVVECIKHTKIWRTSIGPKVHSLKAMFHHQRQQHPIEMADTPTVPTPPVTTTFVSLREPLLESQQ